MATLRWLRLPRLRRDRYFTLWAIFVFIVFTLYARYVNKHDNDVFDSYSPDVGSDNDGIQDLKDLRYSDNQEDNGDVEEGTTQGLQDNSEGRGRAKYKIIEAKRIGSEDGEEYIGDRREPDDILINGGIFGRDDTDSKFARSKNRDKSIEMSQDKLDTPVRQSVHMGTHRNETKGSKGSMFTDMLARLLSLDHKDLDKQQPSEGGPGQQSVQDSEGEGEGEREDNADQATTLWTTAFALDSSTLVAK